MTERESVVQRIAKLYAHAQSAEELGSEAEAQVFLDKVHALLAEHEIELDEAVRSGSVAGATITGEWITSLARDFPLMQKRDQWQMIVAKAIAALYGCAILFDGGNTNNICLYGKPENRLGAAVAITACILSAQQESLREQRAYRQLQIQQRNVGRTGDFRRGWLLGYAVRVQDRAAAAQIVDGRGVALMCRAKQLAQAVADEASQGTIDQKPPKALSQLSGLAGWQAGREAGGRAKLRESRELGGTA